MKTCAGSVDKCRAFLPHGIYILMFLTPLLRTLQHSSITASNSDGIRLYHSAKFRSLCDLFIELTSHNQRARQELINCKLYVCPVNKSSVDLIQPCSRFSFEGFSDLSIFHHISRLCVWFILLKQGKHSFIWAEWLLYTSKIWLAAFVVYLIFIGFFLRCCSCKFRYVPALIPRIT